MLIWSTDSLINSCTQVIELTDTYTGSFKYVDSSNTIFQWIWPTKKWFSPRMSCWCHDFVSKHYRWLKTTTISQQFFFWFWSIGNTRAPRVSSRVCLEPCKITHTKHIWHMSCDMGFCASPTLYIPSIFLSNYIYTSLSLCIHTESWRKVAKSCTSW